MAKKAASSKVQTPPQPFFESRFLTNLGYICWIIGGLLLLLGGIQLFTNDISRNNLVQSNITPTQTEAPLQSTTPIPTTDTETTIKVYLFDKQKYDNPVADYSSYYVPVNRTTNRADIATFGIEEIIKGPTSDEIKSGLAPTFGLNTFAQFVNRNSNCNGRDFKIIIDSQKLATVQFCEDISLSGDLSGIIIEGQIVNTLKQFPTVQKVLVLNKQGGCFNDLKGVASVSECLR